MRDYSSISPSAKGLLVMKGLTDIPFMADAVELIFGRPAEVVLGSKATDITFVKRLIHFEARYKSINNLLNALGGENILEISSGFSFRGLDKVMNNAAISYVDTDLPGVIADKDDLTTQLIAQKKLSPAGELMSVAMNALDEESVLNTAALLPPGPISIVNEGLLMYFNLPEKQQLCRIIHKLLLQRGGYWATADIYIKKAALHMPDDMVSQFLQSHNVEDNKFESFDDAAAFFTSQGFKIIRKAEPVWGQLSALKYVPPQAWDKLAGQAMQVGRIRESWALAAV